MLNKEEELYLDRLIERAEIRINDGYGTYMIYTAEDVLTICKKFREINNECARVHEELQKANEELARVYEVYGP